MVLEINMDRFPLAPNIYNIVHWMECLSRLKYILYWKQIKITIQPHTKKSKLLQHKQCASNNEHMQKQKRKPRCASQKPYNRRIACLYTIFCLTKAQCYDHTQQEEPSVSVHRPPAHSPCWCYITAAVTKAIVFPARQGSLHYQDLYACLGTVTHIHGWTLTFNWACNTPSNRCQMKLWLNSSVKVQFL